MLVAAERCASQNRHSVVGLFFQGYGRRPRPSLEGTISSLSANKIDAQGKQNQYLEQLTSIVECIGRRTLSFTANVGMEDDPRRLAQRQN